MHSLGTEYKWRVGVATYYVRTAYSQLMECYTYTMYTQVYENQNEANVQNRLVLLKL